MFPACHREPPSDIQSDLLAGESFKAVLDLMEADADGTLVLQHHAKGSEMMSFDANNSPVTTVYLLG